MQGRGHATRRESEIANSEFNAQLPTRDLIIFGWRQLGS